jgi:hypothetical protein
MRTHGNFGLVPVDQLLRTQVEVSMPYNTPRSTLMRLTEEHLRNVIWYALSTEAVMFWARKLWPRTYVTSSIAVVTLPVCVEAPSDGRYTAEEGELYASSPRARSGAGYGTRRDLHHGGSQPI